MTLSRVISLEEDKGVTGVDSRRIKWKEEDIININKFLKKLSGGRAARAEQPERTQC